MAIVTVSGHAKIMGQRELEYTPKAFKLWEKAIFEKRDGTTTRKTFSGFAGSMHLKTSS